MNSDIISRLSSGQDRRDQGPNRQLAEEIVRTQDQVLLNQVVAALEVQQTERVGNELVLVLTAISEKGPALLRNYSSLLLAKLESKSNRQVFGSMIALANIVNLVPEQIEAHLSTILSKMESGTVVTRDHGFRILCHLYTLATHRKSMGALILEQLHSAPDNQLGQYAERFLSVVHSEDRFSLEEVLESRMSYLTNEHHRKRLAKAILKLRRQNHERTD